MRAGSITTLPRPFDVLTPAKRTRTAKNKPEINSEHKARESKRKRDKEQGKS